jgi:hypothetical protein
MVGHLYINHTTFNKYNIDLLSLAVVSMSGRPNLPPDGASCGGKLEQTAKCK